MPHDCSLDVYSGVVVLLVVFPTGANSEKKRLRCHVYQYVVNESGYMVQSVLDYVPTAVYVHLSQLNSAEASQMITTVI